MPYLTTGNMTALANDLVRNYNRNVLYWQGANAGLSLVLGFPYVRVNDVLFWGIQEVLRSQIWHLNY